VIETAQPQNVREGAAHPRGATVIAEGVGPASFSAHATQVEVCTFAESGERK
jgi:pullulanase/glycogen debranching enzyme